MKNHDHTSAPISAARTSIKRSSNRCARLLPAATPESCIGLYFTPHSSPLTFCQSCTSGKAGGLICEPLKAVWPATPARFLFEHLQLIESTIFFLLLSDVISHL